MQFPHYESGLQFLGRLIKRPSLDTLEMNLFPHGIKPKEVIEIAGEVNCGKTYLMTQLMAKCILPKCFEGLQIGGLDVSIVFINTDYHFEIFKLLSLLKSALEKCCSVEKLSSLVTENILKYSLNKITILNCTDSNHFKIMARLVAQIVLDDPNVGAVFIDSISAYYSQDRQCGGPWKYSAYTETVLKTLKPVSDLQVPIFYTRPSYFISRSKRFKSSEFKTNEAATCKINLSGGKILENGDACYKCFVEAASFRLTLLYKIGCEGLHWLPIDVG